MSKYQNIKIILKHWNYVEMSKYQNVKISKLCRNIKIILKLY